MSRPLISMLNKDSVKNLFSESGKTISEAKYCIFIATILYCCALVIGWAYPDNFPFLQEVTGKLADKFLDKKSIAFVLQIFAHNLFATYLTMCLVVLFGIIPASIAIFNGIIMGWVIAKVSGVSGAEIAVMIVPHGIFELPAMMIAWGVGIWRGFGYRFSETRLTSKERWRKANIVFFTMVLPLLFFAAIIEGRYHILKEFFK